MLFFAAALCARALYRLRKLAGAHGVNRDVPLTPCCSVLPSSSAHPRTHPPTSPYRLRRLAAVHGVDWDTAEMQQLTYLQLRMNVGKAGFADEPQGVRLGLGCSGWAGLL